MIARRSHTNEYGIVNYVADTFDDLKTILNPIMGSTVYVIDTQKTFILNSQNIWILCDFDLKNN